MSSISHIVKEIVSSDPSTLQCILNDIVNYTKLSKKLKPLVSEAIGHEVSVDTIKMALIRFAEKIFKEFNILKRDVAQVLARSSIEIRTGITIVTIRNAAFSRIAQYIPLLSTRSRFLAIMQSILVTTLILDDESSEEIISRLNKDDIMSIQRDYSAIVIVSPIEIMYTPGVLSYITNILALNNINIVHIESCYTDTIIVVSREDLIKAFQVLSKHIDISKKLLTINQHSVTNPDK
ncbi:MAG: ACT domain-containing protein [Ignisphaera sp.]|uniref:ACT domain-containing protein n=1 Tax=Ignisphaera aggregans TaxID=334771 RepID=A0A7J3MXG9_9CREN